MEWEKVTAEYHAKTLPHRFDLQSLSQEWERELAALWRLETDVNNGGYLQFFSAWGKQSYLYASQALIKIEARRMAEIIDRCQMIVDEHFRASSGSSNEDRRALLPNQILAADGTELKKSGSVLPNAVVDELLDLSYEFMGYPEDIAELGKQHYQCFIDS
jgi:hypothetical protein